MLNDTNNRDELVEGTTREVTRINLYEKKWKIKSNITKFNLISISKTRPSPVYIDNRQVQFKSNCSILRLKVKRTRILSHITARINAAKMQFQKFRRFIRLSVNTKLHLHNALVRPILEYLIIPNALVSKNQLRKMQIVKNRYIKIIQKHSHLRKRTSLLKICMNISISSQ